jgi:four helix bundle protein
MQDYRNLKVWQKAHALTLAIYQATSAFPTEERFGLTIQLRRVAVLIPTNIADGCGRDGDVDFHRLLSAAMGAGSQLDYLLLLAHDLGFLPKQDHSRLTAELVEVRKMLAGLTHRLNG